MNQRLFLIIVACIFTSCSSQPKDDGLDKSKDSVAEQIEWLVSEHNLTSEFLKEYKSSDFKKGLSTELRNELQKRFSLSANYSAFLIEQGDVAEGIEYFIIGLNSVNGDFITFLTVNDKSEILFSERLTMNECDIVDQDDEKEVIWCDKKEASLLKGRLYTTKVHVEEQSYGKYSLFEKDSIVSIYELSKTGLLNLVMTDSVRLNYRRDGN